MADGATSNPLMTHQQVIAPSGEHDTHLYDPNAIDDHQLIAVYDTAATAEAARARLTGNGLPADAIRLVDRTREDHSQGLWAAIKRALLPDEDAHGYAESIHRGHALLVVRPGEANRVEVIRAIEATQPIDFDARLAEWRAAGWNGLATEQAGGAPALTAPDNQAGASAMTTATGRAATIIQSASPPAEASRSGGQAYDTETRQPEPLFTGGTFSGTDPDSTSLVKAYGKQA